MKPGRWVRIKCGKYQGNLAQVIDITENSEEVGLKFIPHINLSLKDNIAATVGGKKCKKVGIAVSMGMCPPPHFFNYEEVVKVYKRKMVLKWNQVYMFQNNTYKDGFIKKDFWLSVLQLNNVNPTLNKITWFMKGQDGGEGGNNNVDLSIIAEASHMEAITVLQPRDHVEVFRGEQLGMHGVVDSITQDIIVVSPIRVNG